MEMSVLQMNISAGILIVVIMALRALAGRRLPRTMFVALWMIALFRLLCPFSIPSPYQAYTFINRMSEGVLMTFGLSADKGNPTGRIIPYAAYTEAGHVPSGIDPYTIVWVLGAVLLALFFAASFYSCYRDIRTALPLKGNAFIENWLLEQKTRRPIRIFVSDQITTPITYGILKPKIILPKLMDVAEAPQLRYILTHELVHIQRWDALWKLLLVITVCIHWFNPCAWVLFVLMNRDLEIACDEKVIRRFGEKSKSDYARSLIDMAERKMKWNPLFSSFSKNVTEERIWSIMTFKQHSWLGVALACAIVASSATVFIEKAVDIGYELRGFIQINHETFRIELDQKKRIVITDEDGRVVGKTDALREFDDSSNPTYVRKKIMIFRTVGSEAPGMPTG